MMPEEYLIYGIGGLGYIALGFLAYMIMNEGCGFDEDTAFMLALGWPMTLAFWAGIGLPVFTLFRAYKAFHSIIHRLPKLRSKSRKALGEVK